ncbi:tetratricopeptide repeat protein [Rhodocaloribacter litoris]|uniref:tetratricopeptide repeat protein n=1 Tax=Rhodocaloribacter litoris TaxID=2558931 RepID=UPI0021D419C5|nr:tetratricopeptide repeat protein [Rhodocaloribacter litoris]QXD14725.1 tetratricopeptide repeat protein [Rhodocaloribacter litoris]GIV59189.1 MAG: hypothetical protein KatS3mg043_0278 [Rhodothermaceae bacterium]
MRRLPVAVATCAAAFGLLGGAAAGQTPAPVPGRDEVRAEQLFVRGMTRAYLEDHEAALQLFQEALRLRPNEPAILSALADAYAALDDLPSALFYAEQARARAPDNVHYHEQVARLHLAAGDTARAVAAYEALLAVHPDYLPALQTLAHLQAGRGHYEAALAALERLHELTGDVPGLLDQMLQLYRRLGDNDGLETTLQRLLAREPNRPDYLQMLAELYVRQERAAEAATLYETLLARRPGDVELILALAHVYRAMGEEERARALVEQATGAAPASAGQRVAQATPFLERAGADPEAARAARHLLLQALELDPGHAGALEALGNLDFDTGAYAEAADRLTRAARLTPRRLDLWTRAAAATLQAGRAHRAADLAEEALLLFPGNLELLHTAAFAHLRLQQEKIARTHFEEALSLLQEETAPDPGLQADLMAGLGLALARQADPSAPAARIDSLFARARHLAPHRPAVLNLYATYLLEHRHAPEQALPPATEAVDLAPENPSFLGTLGRVYLQLGRLDEAERRLARAVATGRADATVYEHYGDLLARLGRTADARAFWQKALELHPGRAALQAKLQEQ